MRSAIGSDYIALHDFRIYFLLPIIGFAILLLRLLLVRRYASQLVVCASAYRIFLLVYTFFLLALFLSFFHIFVHIELCYKLIRLTPFDCMHINCGVRCLSLHRVCAYESAHLRSLTWFACSCFVCIDKWEMVWFPSSSELSWKQVATWPKQCEMVLNWPMYIFIAFT